MKKIIFKMFGIREEGLTLVVTSSPIRWLFSLIVLIYAIVCLYSGWFIVGSKDNATVRLLGTHLETYGPGLHLKLPWPFTKVVKTNVTEYNRIEIGFRTIEVGPPAKYEVVPDEAYMLTGDDNIAAVEYVVQYRVNDVEKWQYGFEDPKKLLDFLSQSAMRLIVGQKPFDLITTSGRTEIQGLVVKELQSLCDSLELGAFIARINIQDTLPPGDVGLAFKDVNNAKTDKERFTNEGLAYKNDIVPKAQGEASAIINRAKGQASVRLQQAIGEINRWNQVQKEFRKNPEIIKQKLQFEMIPEIFKDARIVIDKSGDGGVGVLKHLGLNNISSIPTETEKNK